MHAVGLGHPGSPPQPHYNYNIINIITCVYIWNEFNNLYIKREKIDVGIYLCWWMCTPGHENVYVYLRVLVLDPQRGRRLQDVLELWKSRLDGWLADCHFKSGRWQCRCRQVSSYGRHNKIINNNWPLPSAGETAHGRRWRAAVAVQ